MMGKTDNQMQLIVLDIDSLIPSNHLLRQIKKELSKKITITQVTIDQIEVVFDPETYEYTGNKIYTIFLLAL